MQTELEVSCMKPCVDSVRLDARTMVCRISDGVMGSLNSGGLRTAMADAHVPLIAAEPPPLAMPALQRCFEVLAQTYPGAVAVQRGACRLTYGELDLQADGLAVLLQQRGIGAGSVVAICMTSSLAIVRAVLAVLKSGGASLLLDPVQVVAPLSVVLAAWGAADIVMADATRLPAMAAQQLRCTEDGAELPSCWPEEYPLHPTSPAYAYQNAEAGAALQFESRLSLLGKLQAIQALSPIRQGEAVLQSCMTSAAAFPFDALWALSHGAKLLMAAPGETDDPASLRQLIRREHIVAMHATPALRTLVEREPDHADLATLRTVFCAIPFHA